MALSPNPRLLQLVLSRYCDAERPQLLHFDRLEVKLRREKREKQVTWCDICEIRTTLFDRKAEIYMKSVGQVGKTGRLNTRIGLCRSIDLRLDQGATCVLQREQRDRRQANQVAFEVLMLHIRL